MQADEIVVKPMDCAVLVSVITQRLASPNIDRKCGSNFAQRTSIVAIEEGPET
jgi:hypothetical protein